MNETVTVKITADTRRADGWVQGTASDETAIYEFCAKVYDEKSEFGINGGRVSKLGIRYRSTPIVNYDRGWDLRPDKSCKPIYKAIMAELKKLPKIGD